MKKGTVILSPDRALCRIEYNDPESNRLENPLQVYGGIFSIYMILVRMSSFLTTDEFIQFTGATTLLLAKRYELFSYRNRFMGSSTNHLTLHRFKLSQPYLLTSPNERSIKVDSGINSLTISGCGNYIATASDSPNNGRIAIWNSKTGECIQTLPKKHYGTQRVVFSPDAKQIAFTHYGPFFIFDRETQQYNTTDRGTLHARLFMWCNDGNIISVNEDFCSLLPCDRSPILWNSHTGECIRSFVGHERGVIAIHLLPGGAHFISGSWDGTIKTWDINTGRCLFSLKLTSMKCGALEEIAISPNGKYIVARTEGGFFVYDMHEKKHIDIKYGIKGEVILISQDSEYFITKTDSTIGIWHLATGTFVSEKKFKCEVKRFCSLGEKMVIGFYDGTIEQYSFASLSCSSKEITTTGFSGFFAVEEHRSSRDEEVQSSGCLCSIQ